MRAFRAFWTTQDCWYKLLIEIFTLIFSLLNWSAYFTFELFASDLFQLFLHVTSITTVTSFSKEFLHWMCKLVFDSFDVDIGFDFEFGFQNCFRWKLVITFKRHSLLRFFQLVTCLMFIWSMFFFSYDYDVVLRKWLDPNKTNVSSLILACVS